jgi:hypothetical protein
MSERAYTKAELKQLLDERAEELVNVFFEELKKDQPTKPDQHTPTAVAAAIGAFLDIAFREENTVQYHRSWRTAEPTSPAKRS